MTETGEESTEIQDQNARNYRWNFRMTILDGASFGFGISFFSYTIILPLYVSHFTSNPLLIGMVPFLYTLGYLVPQLFIANVVERAPLKKVFPVRLGFFSQRVPILLMAPATWFFARGKPETALLVFFSLYAWHTMGSGLQVVGWMDMIAKVFKVQQRGKVLGISNSLGNLLGLFGAVVIPVLLGRFEFPLGYVICFAIGSVFVLMSWIFFSRTKEIPQPNPKPVVSQREYFRALPAILRRDVNFRTYLLAQVLFSLSGMGVGFLVVHSATKWNLPDSQASLYTLALQAGLALGFLLLGFFTDRHGHRLNLLICMALSVLAYGLAIVAPASGWFFVVFFLRGVINAGSMLSGIAIVYEFTNAHDRATYIGLANTIPGIFGAIAPFVGGWLAGLTSYSLMFAGALGVGILAFLVLQFFVREPRTAAALSNPIQNEVTQ